MLSEFVLCNNCVLIFECLYCELYTLGLYVSLQNYDHVPSARVARKALCSQMTEMMLDKWREHRLICENYYPAKTHTGCSPGAMHFYHWGALNGFISLVEAGMY